MLMYFLANVWQKNEINKFMSYLYDQLTILPQRGRAYGTQPCLVFVKRRRLRGNKRGQLLPLHDRKHPDTLHRSMVQ